MDVKVAAFVTGTLIDKVCWSEDQPEYGKAHLRSMVQQIQEMDVTDPKTLQKAMRWLGWLQCAVVIGGAVTLDDVKKINVEA